MDAAECFFYSMLIGSSRRTATIKLVLIEPNTTKGIIF